MMYHIPGVLPPQDIARFREQLEQAEWMDRRITTGAQDAQVKNNQQVNTRNALYTALRSGVLSAVNQHALFFTAASPRTLSTPLFDHYQSNETYGFHVGDAVRSHPQDSQVHTGPLVILFLDDLGSYDSGELVVNDTFGQHRVELPADDLVLYPSNSLYCVTPVTRGVRVASSMWVQSMIRDGKRRVMLFELGNNVRSPRNCYGKSEEILSLLNLCHNLLQGQLKI